MRYEFRRHALIGFSLLAVALGGNGYAIAQVVVPPQAADQLTVSVNADSTLDPGSGLYTYTYEITNEGASAQELWLFALEITGEAQNPSAPNGWSFAGVDDRPIITWAATEIGELPPDFVDDGNLIPSPFQIKPGETLGGFSFQSDVPPGPVQFFAQGFTPLPQVTVDVDELPQEGQEILDFTENSFSAATTGPVSFVAVPIDSSARH